MAEHGFMGILTQNLKKGGQKQYITTPSLDHICKNEQLAHINVAVYLY